MSGPSDEGRPTTLPEVLILEQPRSLTSADSLSRATTACLRRSSRIRRRLRPGQSLAVGPRSAPRPALPGSAARAGQARAGVFRTGIRCGRRYAAQQSRFGKWVGVELSSDNHRQLWIPPGFAHGFLVLSESADFEYKVTAYYAPDAERSVRWDDPALGIRWPDSGVAVQLSRKDIAAPALADAQHLA